MSLQPENPEYAEMLAMILDRGRSMQERETALAKLVQQFAKQRPNWPEDFWQEAWLHLRRQCLELGKYDAERGEFLSWFYRLVVNLYRDYLRRERRAFGATTVAFSGTLEPAAPAETMSVEALESQRQRLRQALDQAGLVPAPAAHKVSHRAVLLLQLRQAWAKRVHKASFDGTSWETRAAFVAWCGEWTTEEESLCVKKSWPPLATLWQAMGPVLETPPYWLDGRRLCDVLHQCLAATRPAPALCITADLWHHWVKRAADYFERRLDPHDWEVLRPFFTKKKRDE